MQVILRRAIPEMNALGFPCAEDDCYLVSEFEVQIRFSGCVIRIGICDEHATTLKHNADIEETSFSLDNN